MKNNSSKRIVISPSDESIAFALNAAGLGSPTPKVISLDFAKQKFERIRMYYQIRKTDYVHNRALADKYTYLINNYADKPDEELEKMWPLTPQEKAKIDEIVAAEMDELFNALVDPNKFKKYFFEDLVPIMERFENNLIVQKHRHDPIERDLCKQEKLDQWTSTDQLTVKLLLTNVSDRNKDLGPSFMKFLIQQYALSTNSYGINHAALQVGPHIMDWNDSGLVIPRAFKSERATLFIPITEVPIKRTEENLMKIAKFVVDWNLNYRYANTNSLDRHYGNCQFFVDRFLSTMQIIPSWIPNGPIMKTINKIKYNNVGENLCIWDSNGKEHVFACHQDLLDYYQELVRAQPNGEQSTDPTFREMMALLKSMERVFQLRYAAEAEKQKHNNNNNNSSSNDSNSSDSNNGASYAASSAAVERRLKFYMKTPIFAQGTGFLG